MDIAFTRKCGLEDSLGRKICPMRKLTTWYKSVVAILGCVATIIYYVAKSPVAFPRERFSEMGVDPDVIALISPHVSLGILAVIFLISVAIILSDEYDHTYGVFFASVGVPAAILAVLKTVG